MCVRNDAVLVLFALCKRWLWSEAAAAVYSLLLGAAGHTLIKDKVERTF